MLVSIGREYVVTTEHEVSTLSAQVAPGSVYAQL